MKRTIVDLVCDFCQKTVEGYQGTATMKVPYIQIKGQVTFYEWNNEINRRKWTHITRKGQDELIFCNVVCFQAYIDGRIAWWKDYQKSNTQTNGHEFSDQPDWQ